MEFNFGETFDNMQGSFEPLPKGEYIVVFDRIEDKAAKSGLGKVLHIDLKEVKSGKYIKEFITYTHKNEIAQNIGRQRLKDIQLALGLAELKSTDQLLGKHVKVFLNVQTSTEYPDSNKVSQYVKLDKAASPAKNTFVAEVLGITDDIPF